MAIEKRWTKIRSCSSSDEFWNGLQNFIQMAKPFANDRGLIKCPYNRCVNNDKHQLDVLGNHIFWNGFMAGNDVRICHGKNVNATVTSNMPEQNKGIPDMDEIFDMLDDIISDDAKIDPVAVELSDV